MDVTASFLAGSILGWALPLALLIAILVWWMIVLRRRGDGEGPDDKRRHDNQASNRTHPLHLQVPETGVSLTC